MPKCGVAVTKVLTFGRLAKYMYATNVCVDSDMQKRMNSPKIEQDESDLKKYFSFI